MGIWEKTKQALGAGAGKEDGGDVESEEWMDDVNSEVETVEGGMEEEDAMSMETEPAEREWDSAYRFAEEYLEMRGFSSMVDFTTKCMAYKINHSPMFRDRISHGVQTMNQISSMQQQIRQMRGEGSQGTDYEEMARKLQSANEVIDQTQKLAGEEEAMVQDIMSMGHELIGTLGEQRQQRANARNIDSDVSSVDGEM